MMCYVSGRPCLTPEVLLTPTRHSERYPARYVAQSRQRSRAEPRKVLPMQGRPIMFKGSVSLDDIDLPCKMTKAYRSAQDSGDYSSRN
jgi:hypothetical protein